MFTAYVITVSDKGSIGERVDTSGEVIVEILKENNYEVIDKIIIPDDQATIEEKLKYSCDILEADLILTTGGTGFSKRDVTPEATLNVATKNAFGICDSIRQYSLTITKRAMLSRAVSVIRNDSLIINLPGSPKAVRESLEYIIDSVEHGLQVLLGTASECARK